MGKPRFPSRLDGDLTVSADSGCEQCGSKRVRIRVNLGPDDDDEGEDE